MTPGKGPSESLGTSLLVHFVNGLDELHKQTVLV